ncbi:MAG: Na/Pi cotransporter family protein [Flavobacteriales bacterium]|nr:Na/Pi cotransporter family protein [Flavobacteriales bacterium]
MYVGLIQFLMLAGTLGLFVFGMRMMSEGLQQTAGNRMRRVLERITAGRSGGVLTGISTTVIVQYSSVVSVIVVSFVNSGLLSLRKAIPVLIGANIGTTLKLLLFAAVGFSALDLPAIALALLALALPLLLIRGTQVRATSGILVGAALLFLALWLMKEHLPMPRPETLSILNKLEGMGLFSNLLFVAVGAMLAIIIQSSSVALVLTVALCEMGTIGYATGAALVLGENIGTTFTANVAALAGNVWAKRAARAHLLIKLIGVLWALILLSPLLQGIGLLTERINGASPYADPGMVKWSLTYLHIAFNVINGLVLLQFIPWIEKTVIRWVPARNAPDEEYRLEYIEDPMMAVSPELSVMEARKEVVKFGRLCRRMLGMVRELLMETDPRARAVLLQRISKYESTTDRIEVEVGRYLTRTGTEVREEAVSKRIRALLAIISDLENVGDILFQMSKTLVRKNDEKLWFAPEQRQDLLEMIGLVDKAFLVMLRNLDAEDDEVALDEAMLMEQHINRQRDHLRRGHLKSVESGEQNIHTGLIYADLYSNCEKIGDHLINVSEALSGRL